MPEHNRDGSPSPEEAINGRALRSLPHHPYVQGATFSRLLGVPTQSHRIEAVGSLLEESLVFAEGAEGQPTTDGPGRSPRPPTPRRGAD